MSTGFDTCTKHGKRALEHLANYRMISPKVKDIVQESWGARVYASAPS